MTWWDGFWKPDTDYLATVNTTNLRSITGVRLSVFLVLVGVIAFGWATGRALPYCGGGACAASALERESAAKFADSIFDSLLLFAAGLVGISVGGYIGKRATDTGHKVAVEEAKKAPVLAVPPAPPVPPVSITAHDQSTVKVDAEPGGTATPRPMEGSEGHPLPAATEPDGSDPKQEWASGDPRAGLL